MKANSFCPFFDKSRECRIKCSKKWRFEPNLYAAPEESYDEAIIAYNSNVIHLSENELKKLFVFKLLQ